MLLCLPNGAGKTHGMAASTADERDSHPSSTLSPGLTFLDHEALGENVVFSDALAMMRISNILAQRNREYRTRLNVATSLDDLRQGPAVLIGGLDNQWTLQAIAPLRYRFAGSDADRYWIEDSTDPSRKDWSLDLKTKLGNVTQDYALIARLRSDQTGQMEVVVAGIGMRRHRRSRRVPRRSP